MIVCICNRLTVDEIREMVGQGKTVEQIQTETKAGLDCGACRNQLKRIVEKERARISPGPSFRAPLSET
jgi:bacterioferritin-associated ferredoxin